MKILFINPAVGYYTRGISNPLGLLALASYLKVKGHSVRVIDRCVQKVDLHKEIEIFRPDVVGISIMSGRGLKDATKVSRIAKKHNLPIIAGGYFPTLSPEIILNSGISDIVICGEGEITFEELLISIQEGRDYSDIDGIVYLNAGKVIKNKERVFADLKDFPPIDWTLVNPSDYFQKYFHCNKLLYLYASKGCPGQCTFCTNRYYNKSTFRKRPDEYVLEELKTLVNDYGMDGAYFAGELWNIKREDALEFCDKLEASSLQFTWGMLSRIGQYSFKDFSRFFDVGCRFIYFGVESGSAEMLKRLKKHMDLGVARQTFADCQKAGITSVASFMIGLPDETQEELQKTLDYIKTIEASIILIYPYSPIQNTEIYDELVGAGRLRINSTNVGKYSKNIAMENPGVNFSCIPDIDLKVIKAHFDWKAFSGKKTVNESYSYAFAYQTIINGLKLLFQKGFVGFWVNGFKALEEFLHVFYYSHMYPSILKKYNLK